jgi:gamma-glutamylputrescine oxidase
VVVIGAGLTGASTAYHLARRGIPTVVYEANTIGEGASGRTGGLVLEGTAVGPLEQAGTCLEELKNLVEAEQFDCGLHLPGCWEIEHGERRDQPLLPWNDGGQPVHVAGTVKGGVVDPRRLLAGIIDAAARLGAGIKQNEPALRIVTETRPAVEFADFTITPEYVVVAVNAWLSSLLPAVNIRSCLTFACATEPLDSEALETIGLGAGIPFYTADLPYLWGRITDDSRVIFGSGLVFGSPRQLEQTDVSTGSSRTALAQLEERVRRLHPRLANVGISASWGGPIAFTADAVPILARLPACPKIIVAGAYAGHGVALSVRAGQLIARAIADGADLPGWGALDRNRSNRGMRRH